MKKTSNGFPFTSGRVQWTDPRPWVAATLITGGTWWVQLAVLRTASELPWLAASGAAMLAGFVALRCLRPTRAGMSAPQTMLLLGMLGMLLGLAWDARGAGLAVLASLCISAARQDFLDALQLHWTWLPAMHIGMIVGGAAAVPVLRIATQCRRQLCARVCQNIACSAWMVVGMTFGALFFQRAALSLLHGEGPAVMLGGMFAGMVWGMVASVAAYRLYFRLRTRPD